MSTHSTNPNSFIRFLIISVGIKIASTVFSLYSSRLLNSLNPIEYSQYNQVIALTTIVLAVVVFGVPQVIQKFFTQQHSQKTRQQIWTFAMIFRGLSYFIGAILMLIFLPLTEINDYYFAFILYSVQFLLVIDLSYRAVADATGNFLLFSLSDFAMKAVVAVCLFVIVSFYNFTLPIYITILACAYFLTVILDSILFRKYTQFCSFTEAVKVKKIFSQSVSFLGFSSILIALYSGIDIIILGRLGFSAIDINSYANAYKFYILFLIIPGVVIPPLSSFLFTHKFSKSTLQNSHIFSKISNLFQNFTQKVYTIIALLLATGGFTALFIFNFAEVFILLIDPEFQYTGAVVALQVLAFSFIFIFPGSFITQLFIYKNKEKLELFVTISTAIFAIFGYYIGISMFGIVGAAMATVGYLGFDFFIKLVITNKILTEK